MASEACAPTAASISGSAFDDEWRSFGCDGSNAYGNLDHLDLDDILGPVPTNSSDAAPTINPQFLDGAANLAKHGDEDNIVLGAPPKVKSPEQYVLASSPTYHRLNQSPDDFDFGQYLTPPCSHQVRHRRSVSEPPASFPTDNIHSYGVPAPLQPAMTFTRSGVSLGSPKVHHGNRVTRMRHPHVQRPYPWHRTWTQERYHLRRSNTQPLQQGPTSVPTAMHQIIYPSPLATLPVQVASASMTSRVCTPAPSPQQLPSGSVEVPAHPFSSTTPCEERKALTTTLTEKELRSMITEAVQTALSSTRVRSSIQRADAADGGVGVEGGEEA